MSAASVPTSGRRDNLPVLPKAAGNKGEPGSASARFVIETDCCSFAILIDSETKPQFGSPPLFKIDHFVDREHKATLATSNCIGNTTIDEQGGEGERRGATLGSSRYFRLEPVG